MGGAYGKSVYVLNLLNGWERYITHLDDVLVVEGDRVWPGRVIGSICSSEVTGSAGTSHVHLGLKH
jgi:hypothetical protein